MTSNTTPPPLVASALTFYPDQQPFMAFDNDSNYTWMGQGPPQWVQIDFGAGQSFHMFTYTIIVEEIFAIVFFPTRVLKSWTVEGSDDALAWTVVDTQINQTGWFSIYNPTGPTRRTYTCAVTGTGYRYFRINISENQGDAGNTLMTGWNFGAQFNHFY